MAHGLSIEDRASIERASYEVDESLLDWFSSLTLRERLRSAARFLTTLNRFQVVKSDDEAPENLAAR